MSELPEKISQTWCMVQCKYIVFDNKLPRFVFELVENDISNVGSSVGSIQE